MAVPGRPRLRTFADRPPTSSEVGGHVTRWLEGPAPRRFFERTPLGVPIVAALTTAGLAIGAALRVVPTAVAWDVGGPLALLAEAFALYGWIAVRRARRTGAG